MLSTLFFIRKQEHSKNRVVNGQYNAKLYNPINERAHKFAEMKRKLVLHNILLKIKKKTMEKKSAQSKIMNKLGRF